MDLFDAITLRASVRELEPADIPDEHIEAILDAGRRAPSGMNVQPVEFILVREKQTLGKLARVQGFIGQASAAICLVADPEASTYWLEDASAAAENMLLAIAGLGYGSTWVEGTLLRREGWAKDLLGVPDHLRLVICLPIGRPASAPQQAMKKPLADLLHREEYGRRDG